MRPRTRRTVLTTAGVALAGCVGTNRDSTATGSTPSTTERTDPPAGDSDDAPVDGPAPLGRAAVPEGSADPPGFRWERTYDVPGFQDAVDATAHGDGLAVLTAGDWGDDVTAATVLDVTTDGSVRDRRRVDGLPTGQITILRRLDETVVLGGLETVDDAHRTWLRGVRDGDTAFETTVGAGTTVVDAVVDGGGLVAAGTTGWNSDDEEFDAHLTRVGPEGGVDRLWTSDRAGTADHLWGVTATTDGYLAGGARGGDAWVVAVDRTGRVQWERRVRRGEQSYTVEAVTGGDTGTYAVAETEQYATGDNHLLLLSLDSDRDGEVEWTRVFDPNPNHESPGDLHYGGVVDDGGPRLVGHTRDRVWLGATDGDGAVRWAGYHRHRSGTRLLARASVVEGRLVCHGRSGEKSQRRAWVGRR